MLQQRLDLQPTEAYGFNTLFIQYYRAICRPSDHTVRGSPRLGFEPGTGDLKAETTAPQLLSCRNIMWINHFLFVLEAKLEAKVSNLDTLMKKPTFPICISECCVKYLHIQYIYVYNTPLGSASLELFNKKSLSLSRIWNMVTARGPHIYLAHCALKNVHNDRGNGPRTVANSP